MTLNILHTISGLLIIICFISKVIVHYYLDHQQGRSISFLYSLAAPLQYFQLYRNKVAASLLKMQRLCNLLLILALIALILNILLGVAIYFTYK